MACGRMHRNKVKADPLLRQPPALPSGLAWGWCPSRVRGCSAQSKGFWAPGMSQPCQHWWEGQGSTGFPPPQEVGEEGRVKCGPGENGLEGRGQTKEQKSVESPIGHEDPCLWTLPCAGGRGVKHETDRGETGADFQGSFFLC